MKRVGRLLICIASGVTLGVTARADISPVTPNVSALRQSMSLTNRMLMMKKLHAKFPNGLPQFSQSVSPQKSLPQDNVPQPGITMARVASAKAVPAPATDRAIAPSGNPYESIVTRNVFGLNPIPVAVAAPQQDGPPPPKITLTGITTIFGPAEALFKVAGVVRNGGRPQDESYIFTEGEMQDDVQVTKIDTKKNIVTFVNHGVTQDITLTDTGVATSGSATSSPSWPGQAGIRRFKRPFGGFPAGFQPQQPQSIGGGFQPGANNNFGGNNYGSSYNNPNSQSGLSALSAEDQAALVAAQHAQAVQDNNPLAAIFPPTKYDTEAQAEAGGSAGSPNPGDATPAPTSPTRPR